MKTLFVPQSLFRRFASLVVPGVLILAFCGCLPVQPAGAKDIPSTAAPTASPVNSPVAPTPIPSAAVILSVADAGRNVWLTPGQFLQITLEGNPSTGFTWEVLPIEGAVLRQVGEPVFKSNSELIGAPGMMTFTLLAAAEGRQQLMLVYHRAWEKDVPPANSFDVTVVVSQVQPPMPTFSPTLTPPGSTPTPVTFPASGMKGWLTYTNLAYGFSFQYPSNWELSEGKGTMVGHAVMLAPAGSSITLQVAFKRTSEDAQIGRTGMGAGDLVQLGSVALAGKEVQRQVLVWQGKHMTVSYTCAGCMVRGELEFRFELDYRGNVSDPTALTAEVEAQADLVVASVKLGK